MNNFDSDPARQEKDGAFIAGLLNNVGVMEGQTYYIHRNDGDKNTSYEPSGMFSVTCE